jgi:primosomal protein N'
MPDHPVIAALRHGGPADFMRSVLEDRRAAGFPPSGELLAVEVAPPTPAVDGELRAVAGTATVLGPAEQQGRSRWLVQGRDLHPLRIRLRPQVQAWRDAGLRVRVDADPIDL